MSNVEAAFLVNPLSYAVQKHGSVLAKSALAANVLRYDLDPFLELPKAIDDIISNKIKLVFIEGGDGTVQGALTEFQNRREEFAVFPQFILLPGGMTNLVAGHVGVKKPTPAKIEALLNAPETPKTGKGKDEGKGTNTVHLPLLQIQYENHDFSGFLFSTGALPNGTLYCLDKVHTQGINGASAVRTTLLRVLFKQGAEREAILGATPMRLDIDGEKVNDGHIISIASTLPSLMIGLSPFWGTGHGPVRVSHARGGAKHLILNVIRLLKRKQSPKSIMKLAKAGLRSWAVDTAILHHEGPLVLDGEFLPQTNTPITLSASAPLSFIK